MKITTQPDISTTEGKTQVMLAFCQLKRVQFKMSEWGEWETVTAPQWSWDAGKYRILPDDLDKPEVDPEPDTYAHLKAALAAGKRVRFDGGPYYGGLVNWSFGEYPADFYEIEPDPQPWTMEDVPPVCWVRLKGGGTMHLITGINEVGADCYGMSRYFANLAWDWEHSTDLKTWRPCTK